MEHNKSVFFFINLISLNKNNLSIKSIASMLFFVLLTTAQGYAQKVFAETTTSLPGISRGTVVWGDYNQDGKPDVFISGVSEGMLSGATAELWKNLGNNKFEKVETAIFAKVTHSSAAWADFNGDGYLDLIYCGTTSSNTKGAISKIYINNKGNGTFTELENPVIEVQATGETKKVSLKGVWNIPNISIADYNKDGKPDILIAGNWNSGIPGSYIAALYRNNGDGTFNEVEPLLVKAGKTDKLPGVYFTAVAWGDFNNDGYEDIVITGNTGGGPKNQIARLFKNNTDGTFSEISDKEAPLQKVYKSTVNWVDYNADGFKDIFITGTPGMRTYIAALYKNKNNGTFEEIKNTGITPVCDASVTWFDFDKDGKPDVLVSGFIEGAINKMSTMLYRNNGDGSFSIVDIDLPALYYPVVSHQDINGDGLIDFTVSGYIKDATGTVTNLTKVYLNISKK